MTAPPSNTSQPGASSSDAGHPANRQAVSDAAQAMRDADAAMSAGDWTAYGYEPRRACTTLDFVQTSHRQRSVRLVSDRTHGAPTPSLSPSATSWRGQSSSWAQMPPRARSYHTS